MRRADDNCYFKDLRNTVSTFLSNFNSYLARLLKCGKKKKKEKEKSLDLSKEGTEFKL